MQFLQPMQFWEFLKMICLCHKKPTLHITCFGQASTHAQHALQLRVFAHIYFVWTFFNFSIALILFSSTLLDELAGKIF
jgi:hypothetical protein